MATEIASLLTPVAAWFNAVNNVVKEPYLDEFFHVRQAQHYCEDHWNVWDPKITTPPGLYILSVLCKPVFGCSITGLRIVNVLCLAALVLVLRATYSVRRRLNSNEGYLSWILACHSSFNIVLFPPLFFFSALYYTDVASTLSVMAFYWYFLRILSHKHTTLRRAVIQVALGVFSLSFRQTNIFWVGVAPAALALIIELDQGHKIVKQSMYRRAEGFGDTMVSVAKTSWKMAVVYDLPIRDAFIEDYLRTIISIVACGAKAATQPRRILDIAQALSPYITVIGIFAGFILWNGGVVLGDKSNHIATINLPQMLYLWPFIAFFAWPLLLPQFILLPLIILSRVGQLAHLEPMILFRRQSFIPRLRFIFVFIGLAGVMVYANTVVHPFLLADNRHYHFYIFKLLLRPWWMRYAVLPIYILTAWACLATRGEPSSYNVSVAENRAAARKAEPHRDMADPLAGNAAEVAALRPIRLPDGKSTAMASFVLITLATTGLNLCTAPLVEPRYCIIPYIMWRMHLPLYAVDERHDKQIEKSKSIKAIMEAYDYRVVLETIWLLVINAVTGYIFLTWTFVWPSEPGKLQRFMW